LCRKDLTWGGGAGASPTAVLRCPRSGRLIALSEQYNSRAARDVIKCVAYVFACPRGSFAFVTSAVWRCEAGGVRGRQWLLSGSVTARLRGRRTRTVQMRVNLRMQLVVRNPMPMHVHEIEFLSSGSRTQRTPTPQPTSHAGPGGQCETANHVSRQETERCRTFTTGSLPPS
jgi:hypothetical protein